ncbi:MAG: HAD family hydrolase [Deltaproteobacteria bacterium]|nr:HAD family hydrolase [Deltaproteobacteria bacterium]
MHLIRHVIWDWNGTLLNDAEHALKALNRSLCARDLPALTLERYREIYEHPVRLIYERAGVDLSKESLSVLTDEWHVQYTAGLDEVELHEDALATLQLLREEQVTQTILSTLPHDLLGESVRKRGIGQFFARIQGLDDRLARSKAPNGLALLSQVGASPASTIMIGDSSHDAEVAELIGAQCILVARGLESEERLKRHGLPVCRNFEQAVRTFLTETPRTRE